jgi:hypothetical protein
MEVRQRPSDDGLATRTAIIQLHKSLSSRLSASSDETFPQATPTSVERVHRRRKHASRRAPQLAAEPERTRLQLRI